MVRLADVVADGCRPNHRCLVDWSLDAQVIFHANQWSTLLRAQPALPRATDDDMDCYVEYDPDGGERFRQRWLEYIRQWEAHQ